MCYILCLIFLIYIYIYICIYIYIYIAYQSVSSLSLQSTKKLVKHTSIKSEMYNLILPEGQEIAKYNKIK